MQRLLARRTLIRAAAATLGALTLARRARPAAAHIAINLGGGNQSRATAYPLADADIAWAVFGVLSPGNAQWLRFDRPASGMFRARALVPTVQSNPRLNPWLLLTGPGLERPAGLDPFLEDGEGAVLVGPPDARTVEPFQATPFPVLVGASLELALPGGGPFYLLVFDPTNQAGTYIVDTGYLQD